MPDKNTMTLKKRLPCSKTTHYFSSIFCFLFTYSVCIETAVFFWKHCKKVLSDKHSFSKTQLVKPTFSPMTKNTFFQKKVSFLVLGNFRWNHYFYSVSWFTLFWAQKMFWPKQIVCTKMRFFSLPDTNSVRQFLQKKSFYVDFDFSHFWMTTLKKTIFIGFLGPFPISFFLSFFCFYSSNIKQEKKQKMQFSFRKPHFWHPPNFTKKNTILAQCDTICVFKNTKKHYKNGENSQKTLTSF